MGDQLSHNVSSLNGFDSAHDTVLMCEVRSEATSVKHHKKKIAFLFSAMRHFAAELEDKGFTVRYIQYDDPDNGGSFLSEIKRAVEALPIEKIVVTQPSEYRVQKSVKSWETQLGIPVEIRPDDRFLCPEETFRDWAEGRKNLRMEFFYRNMRRKYGILMEGDQPVGGKWNYDADNRKPPKSGLQIPPPFMVKPDAITVNVMALVARAFPSHFGTLDSFHFAVTRDQALKVLDHFVTYRLPVFGDYQDAMIEGEPWMYHSHLSFYLNCGLLEPLECVRAAENAYHSGHAPLNAAEGFIRQIIGWREYVRGIYALKMPGYVTENFLEAKRPLPDFYWTAETSMNCLKQCVVETRDNAYAHHIQRLMVLGNFALLAGIHPDHVNAWFLIVYADAFEWVELPNVSGMVLFADGGYLASKPYAAGGAYINRMSNYCKSCRYKVKEKSGEDACPFNYLYWDFLARNRDKIGNNHRLGMIYRSYDKMSPERKREIQTDSEKFLDHLKPAASEWVKDDA